MLRVLDSFQYMEDCQILAQITDGELAIDYLIKCGVNRVKGSKLKSAVNETPKKYQPLSTEDRLFNERKIIDELADLEIKDRLRAKRLRDD